MRRRFASRYYADAQVPLSPRAYTPEISYCLVSARVGQLGKELATCVGELPNGLRKHRMLLAGYWQVGGRGLCLGAEKTRSQKNA